MQKLLRTDMISHSVSPSADKLHAAYPCSPHNILVLNTVMK